jgi:hypothetical protein
MYFANLRHVNRCKSCVSCLKALFTRTKVVKHPFLSIGPKMMFGSALEHFANLRHVELWKTRVLGLNALFPGTKVVKHPFLSIGHKLIFGCVSVHFANLRRVKDEKLVFWTWMHYFGVRKLWSIHSTQLDTKWCLGLFQSISLTFDR